MMCDIKKVVIYMDEKFCKSCVHYIQHYGLNKRRLYRLNCGHCTFPKIRNRRPYTVACAYYMPGEADEAAFASKEYLSKELLQYLLHLELLPEIQEAP